MSAGAAQPWIHSARADCAFILAPAFVVAAVVLAFPARFEASNEVEPWMWLLLVVCIDVAHVWSTLYRTYLDPDESARLRVLLVVIPLACWVAGVLLYSLGALAFWRVLAYVAVFHFVRQQYGFFRLYARREDHAAWSRRLDGAAIYLATLYPLVYWHTHPRDFRWFVPGDFFTLPWPLVERVAFVAWAGALAAYAAKEAWRSWQARAVNLPKHAVLAGTALSWYVGIVAFDGDLTFTLTNVVAHGVPYIALVWMYGRRQVGQPASEAARRYRAWWYRPATLPVFVGLLLVLGYAEEGLWDALVWRDHGQLYGGLALLPQLEDSLLLSLVVPLLAVPQATHYVLDGFIWKLRHVFAPGTATL